MGFATTVAPVVAESPVGGDHEYVLAPLALNVTGLPEHTTGAVGATDKVIVEFEVTVADAVDVRHPPDDVTVTVYVPAHKFVAVSVVCAGIVLQI